MKHALPVGFVPFAFAFALALAAHAEDWPQWLGPRRDSTWNERGIVERIPTNGLHVAWRAPIGAGYSAPAIARGRVFVTDRVPATPSETNEPTRGERGASAGRERVLCLDESRGTVLWQHDYDCPYRFSYPSGPRAMPLVDGNRVYTVGADGHLRCLDAKTGRLVWSHHYPTDYGIPTQTWGVASSPLIDGDRLICIVGGAGHAVVAFDKKGGRELWRALDAKEPGYSAPIVIQAGGTRQLIVWDVAALSSLDPATGRVFWSEPFPTKMGHSIGTPRRSGNHLLVSSFFDGSLMMRLDDRRPAASVAWRIKGRDENHPEGLHSLMSTPDIDGGFVYGVCGYGQLRCMKADTGERVWETLEATTTDLKPARWATAFLVKNGPRHFIWNEKGDLILAELTPLGYRELGRQHVLEPTNLAGSRPVVWSHPSFANGHVFVRNDEELIRVDLRAHHGR